MKSQVCGILLGVLVLSLSMTLGCGKKSSQPPAPSSKGTTTPSQPAAPAPVPQAASPAEATAPAPQPSLVQSVTADLQKSVAEVKAKAEAMSVENLKATALQYKDAILAKQADLEKLTAKIKDIPLTQALSQEATTLKTEFQNLQTSTKALKDRFQVYYDTLKQKGADLSNLNLDSLLK